MNPVLQKELTLCELSQWNTLSKYNLDQAMELLRKTQRILNAAYYEGLVHVCGRHEFEDDLIFTYKSSPISYTWQPGSNESILLTFEPLCRFNTELFLWACHLKRVTNKGNQ